MSTRGSSLAAPPLPGIDVGAARRRRLGDVQSTNAAGFVELRLGTPPAGTYWLVDRGAFVVDGPAGGTVLVIVYGGPGIIDDNIEDFAELDVGAVAGRVRAVGEWSPPIWVPNGGELIVTFAGGLAAVQAQARAVARELPNT